VFEDTIAVGFQILDVDQRFGRARTSEKAEAILSNRISLMLAVQSCLQKYFCSRLTQIKSISPPSRPTEGRIAIVTDAGRDAMDAAASGALMARGRMALFRLR
jgi:hypothetical protein